MSKPSDYCQRPSKTGETGIVLRFPLSREGTPMGQVTGHGQPESYAPAKNQEDPEEDSDFRLAQGVSRIASVPQIPEPITDPFSDGDRDDDHAPRSWFERAKAAGIENNALRCALLAGMMVVLFSNQTSTLVAAMFLAMLALEIVAAVGQFQHTPR